ncbi:uncharacterized protein [Amphiura filiformis]|uniref:uncharacterized protein n=1 Tax=Amphiura filiformis TaxID=82378 RepID=UPI003B20C43C
MADPPLNQTAILESKNCGDSITFSPHLPCDIALRDLSHKIGGEWQALATYLGIDTTRIHSLKKDHLSTEDQIFYMLVSWRQSQTSQHIDTLTAALHKAGRVDLAQDFESPLSDVVLRALSTKLGHEWEQLATHLGCSNAEIHRNKMDHHTVDNQIFNLLVSWRQRQPSGTDVKDKFATALRNSGRNDLADLLTNCSSEAWTQPYVFDVKCCRKQLRQFYEDEKATLALTPYDFQSRIAIEDIFVELELHKENAKTKEVEKQKLRSYNALVDLEQVSKKKVLVHGGPGSGKTTLVSKLTHDWSCNIDPNTGEQISDTALSKFSLLLSLNMRELNSGMSLAEAVRDQLLTDDSVISEEGLQAYIKDHQDEVLIILDGYDEYPFSLLKRSKCEKDEIMDVLCALKVRDSYLIVTSRPHRVDEFGKAIMKYANVALTGFAQENIKKYIYKFFQMSEDHYVSEEEQQNRANIEKLITEIEGNGALNTLAKTPVILALLCMLWRDSQELPKRVTQLYEEAMHYLVKRWYERENKDQPEPHEMEKKSEDLLLSLGKVALDGIFENKLIFEAKAFDKEHLEEACRAGLLSKEKNRSKLKTVEEVRFIHKTFQEMCGGKYLADLGTKDPEAFNAYLQRISEENVGNLEYMLRFCCGLSKKAAVSIIPVAVELSHQLMVKVGEDCRLAYDDIKQDPWRLSMLLLFESQCSEEYHLLKPLFNRSKLRIRFHNAEVTIAAQYFFDILENLRKENKPNMLEEISETELVGIRAQDVNGASKLIRNMQSAKELKLVFLTRSEYEEMEQLGKSISQLPSLATLILEGRDCDTSGIIGQLARNSNSSNSMQEFACHLSSFSIDALTIFISRQPSLVRLKLLDNRMTEEDIGKLLKGIQKAKLEVLEIFWNKVGGSSKYIRAFLPTLQSLYLSNTKMNPDNWKEIFCDMSKAVHIEKLDLTWNNIEVRS